MGIYFLVAALLVNQAVETRFAAKVVGVADGDTITVLRDRHQVRIRLDGIDCPEADVQPMPQGA